jgi:regulatory protein
MRSPRRSGKRSRIAVQPTAWPSQPPLRKNETAAKRSAKSAALAALAQRRLTESQLWSKLQRKGYEHDDIAAVVQECKHSGYLDDRLYADLYVNGTRKAVGDARLIAALVAKGIDSDVARMSVEGAPSAEAERCLDALAALERRRPGINYPTAARALERLGFPASVIYGVLRRRIGGDAMLA